VTADVTLPEGVTKTVIVLPLENLTAGTVAMINGEAVKKSVVTDDGLAVEVTGDVTLTIEDKSKDFEDVKDGYWGEDSVDFATSHGLFNGTSTTTFEPENDMNRQMVWTVLARLDGQDTSSGSTWYEVGRNWAMENDITDGYNGESSITREQLVTMLWRYAGEPEASEDAMNAFPDVANVSDYAKTAMAWAVENKIINGAGDLLLPQGNASRVQVAAIAMRYCKNLMGLNQD
jgi:hypothetical protein